MCEWFFFREGRKKKGGMLNPILCLLTSSPTHHFIINVIPTYFPSFFIFPFFFLFLLHLIFLLPLSSSSSVSSSPSICGFVLSSDLEFFKPYHVSQVAVSTLSYSAAVRVIVLCIAIHVDVSGGWC